MKPPGHHEPSGDREIARLLMSALDKAGYRPAVASEFIAYQKRPSRARFDAIRAEGARECQRLVKHYATLPAEARPALWLTYHPYCKAPDWLGPAIAGALNIPYVTVEAAHTRQDREEDWAEGRKAVAVALRQASINFCLKPSDAAYLETVLANMDSVVSLAPFIDVTALQEKAALASPSTPLPDHDTAPLLVAIGMMRPGKKAACYRYLSQALRQIRHHSWRLVLIGDGPERSAVEAWFSDFAAGRVLFTGALGQTDVLAWLKRAALFVWPGYREPIGMVYLEAAALAIPVVAFRSLGVPIVVRDGKTGLLVEEGDTQALAAAIARLLDDAGLRQAMGQAAAIRVRSAHDIEAAARRLKSSLDPLLQDGV